MYQPDPAAASEEAARPLRLFVALPISDAQRRWLGACACRLAGQPEYRGLRWIVPRNMHLTLRFLGETPPSRVAGLCAALDAAAKNSAAPELAFGGPVLLPSPDRPRVLALAVTPPGPLRALAEALDAELVKSGWPPRRHMLMPHISLARRGRGRFPALSSVHKHFGNEVATGPAPSVVADRLTLYCSELKPDGAVYTVMHASALAGEPGAADGDTT